MRKLIFLTILSVAFASCSNVGKYKEAIESLSSDWESTTSQVKATVDQITEAQNQATTALQNMNPSEEVAATLSDEQKNKIATVQQTVQSKVGDLGALAQQALEFIGKWQEEGEKLDALKEGLAGGKLPGDVQATIDSLKGMIGTAGEKVSEWASQVDSAKQAVASATQSYNDVIGGGAQ